MKQIYDKIYTKVVEEFLIFTRSVQRCRNVRVISSNWRNFEFSAEQIARKGPMPLTDFYKITCRPKRGSPIFAPSRQISPSRPGAVLRWGRGGTGPPNVGQPPPPIFWFQQQKYALLKCRLFLYSGEINTRIN